MGHAHVGEACFHKRTAMDRSQRNRTRADLDAYAEPADRGYQPGQVGGAHERPVT